MILSHNSQSKQCSANHTLHANMKTVLPQEWSLFRYGVSRSWLPLFWADPSGAARNPQIQGEQEEYLSCFLPLLALTLLPRSRHFQMQEANRKLAAGRFVLYPESQVVQTNLIPFIWKQNYLHTLQLALSLCLPSLFSFRETVNDSLPVQKTDFHGKTNLAFCLLHCLGPLEWDCWKCSTACFHRFYPVP